MSPGTDSGGVRKAIRIIKSHLKEASAFKLKIERNLLNRFSASLLVVPLEQLEVSVVEDALHAQPQESVK